MERSLNGAYLFLLYLVNWIEEIPFDGSDLLSQGTLFPLLSKSEGKKRLADTLIISFVIPISTEGIYVT